jgi:phospholipid transport system substrate-binding protein
MKLMKKPFFVAAAFAVTGFCMTVPQASFATGGTAQSVQIAQLSGKSDVIKTAGEQQGVNAKTAAGAETFIDNMAGRAMMFLGDQNLSTTEKKKAFKKLLDDSFDMNTIGRFSLGRYWRASTPQERDRYLQLFKKMVLEVYAQRFSDYQGQKFEVRSNRPDGKRDIIVSSAIISGSGPDIQIDWRVRYKDDRYKIVDVVVEGVSMSLTQRSDFAAVIQRGGGKVQTLISHLESKTL